MRFRLLSSAFAVLVTLPLFSCGAAVCFNGDAPQMSSVSPNTIAAGSPATEVAVTGKNFSNGTVLVLSDGTQLSPVSVTSSRMTFSFSALFFNGVGVIQFHLSDGCRGVSNSTSIAVISNPWNLQSCRAAAASRTFCNRRARESGLR
jgi:hypothetical protein